MAKVLVDAIVFVLPDGRTLERVAECFDFAEEHGLRVRLVVKDWSHLIQMIRDGFEGVIISVDRDELDPDRLPRMVFVRDDPPPDDRRHRRRPKWRG